jgi:cell fate (sporulation/competence/biofilm development) regulator YlbF (YheA/YmcA/DUF963 family)
MDDVLARAAELGRAVRETPPFRALRAAEAAVMKDADTVKLAGALSALQQQQAALARQGKSLPAAEKASLEKILAAAAADPRLQALSKAQAEFQALVDSVSRAMLDQLKA